jgi:hypothetical protein
MNTSDLRKLKKFHALLGSDNSAEREAARAKLIELLARHKKTWNDMPELLSTAESPQQQEDDEPNGDPVAIPASLDLIKEILRRHLHLTEHQLVALTLWVAHTFCYAQFSVTPRLALLSPVRSCGKTTLLNIVTALAFKTMKFDHTTPAFLFRTIDRDHPCILLDEGDNQNLLGTGALRTVLNGGYHVDGKFSRCIGGEDRFFSTFAPLAIAAIGELPLPFMSRSVVLRMERAPKAKMIRFDPKTIPQQERQCEAVYRVTYDWMMQMAQCQQLTLDPPMPPMLPDRARNNWRVLLSVADACSPEWGAAARAAAIALSAGQDEDAGVLLLTDIRSIFRRAATDRLSSATIVAGLIDLPEGLWSEWRGLAGNQMPRKLTQGALAMMLAPFNIKPRTIWPSRRGISDKSARGYLRAQFEEAWANYCDEDDTPPQSSNVTYLRDMEA